MGIYFGTDGLRGVYGKDITPNITYKVGSALSIMCKKKKVLIGRDTRRSGSALVMAAACGLTTNGISVVDIGIAPTPVVAYLTKQLGFDYGVMISASHNPKDHNGIKIFDCNGFKISQDEEDKIERNLLYTNHSGFKRPGKYEYNSKLIKLYKQQLINQFSNLDGLKIAIDCANGASCVLAKEVLSKCGAKVYSFNCNFSGKKINDGCGALFPEKIALLTKKYHCDIGFSFDGDADRVIVCDENGNILDGDDILYLLATKYQPQTIVGTSMTNKGLELALKNKGITLLRSDVGDKFVSALMRQRNAFLGGEPCGHIINSNYSSTGDGVLTALSLASLLKNSNESFSSICDYKKLPQICINVEVNDKNKILNNENFNQKLSLLQYEIENEGRILVRASGTERKIRVMCEHQSFEKATLIANNIAQMIDNLDKTP